METKRNTDWLLDPIVISIGWSVALMIKARQIDARLKILENKK